MGSRLQELVESVPTRRCRFRAKVCILWASFNLITKVFRVEASQRGGEKGFWS